MRFPDWFAGGVRAILCVALLPLVGTLGASQATPPAGPVWVPARAAGVPAPGVSAPGVPAPPDGIPAGSGTPLAIDSFRSARTYDAVALPVRLRIPAIHVNTPLGQLGRNPDGTIEVPTDPNLAGWYDGGPRPGQQGPAVILGHVDSENSPAVFYDLPKLKPGDIVYVDLADGHRKRFRVVKLSQVPKNQFPTDAVYLPTLQPSLRLVTCGGSFDYSIHHYRDNVIVYANLF